MVTSNTKECFRYCVGKRVTGVLFDALPPNDRHLSRGTKTLILEDGTGLTIASNGSFWVESCDEIKSAIQSKKRELEAVQTDLVGVLAAAGTPT